MTAWRVEPLANHDRKRFSSGSEPLDRYFREQVKQDAKRRIAYCFVLVGDDDEVAGYYTLSATSIAFDKLSAERTKKLPRYPTVPAVLLGRLAIAKAHHRKRLGGALVADAIMRAIKSDIASHLMIVDAKDETAAEFYEHLGFERLSSQPGRLIRAL
jgi:ribosomal protein S18 acetylase RimI-like enzyme